MLKFHLLYKNKIIGISYQDAKYAVDCTIVYHTE
jgi:hypothetical protein